MPQIHFEQRTQAWLDARKGKITASLAAACLGLDKYCSRQKAWRTILGREPEDIGNRHLARGVLFEPKARWEYEVLTGNTVVETGFWIHDSLPWLGCSPDGLIGEDGGFECKCPMVAPTKIPISHHIQCLIGMACCNRSYWEYFAMGAEGTDAQGVYHPLTTFHCRIERQGIVGLIHRLLCFYRDYVLTEIEPPRKKSKRRKRAA